MKETIKLVLVDIDGTLLNDDLLVTEKTLKAISKLKKKNILFGIATGRTPYAVKHLIKDWGIDTYCDLIMGFNGGACLNLRSGELKSCYLINGNILQEVRDSFKNFDVNYGIFDCDSFHAHRKDSYADLISSKNKLPLFVEDLAVYNGKDVAKMLMMADSREIDRVQIFYQKNIKSTHYRAVRSSPILFEFINPELSKSKGIQNICEDLGIEMENVLTFGDEANDFEMIRDCVGVAMGNAIPSLKKVARYITLSNNEDGIGVFLNEHVLR